MAVWGMDVEDVKNFAKLASAKADELTSLISSLQAKLDNVDWTGPDATKFRTEWTSTHVKNLKTVAQGLEAVAKAATANAAQQSAASK